MSNVTTLPEGIRFRQCPGCGYMVTQLAIVAARFNLECPRCKKHGLNEFVPVDDPPPNGPGGRKQLRIAA